MRSFVVAGICLLLASSAMAATSVSLQAREPAAAGAAPLSGALIAQPVDSTVHSNIVLEVIIETDLAGMTAASLGFSAPAGVGYAPFDSFYGLSIYNYADGGIVGVSPPTSSAGWSTTQDDGNLLGGGDLNSIVADDPVFEMSNLFGATLAQSGTFGWLNVSLVEGQYEIGVRGTVGDPVGEAIPGVLFNGLQVVPEPASALLLLLGVPFLRRRR